MAIIPIHDLLIKDLQHSQFDIIPLSGNGDRNYEGLIPHRHTFYELLLFTAGEGIHEVDFKDYQITPNSLHFVSPSQVHKLKANKAAGFVLCFSTDILYSHLGKNKSFPGNFPFYDFNTYSPYLQIKPTFTNEILELISLINKSFNSTSPFKDEIIKSYLYIILLQIKQVFLSQNLSSKKNVLIEHAAVIKFKKLIDENYLNQYSVKEYANILSVSPNYLNSLCKKETSRSAMQLIHERLLLEAKRLLYSTNLSSKEISFALGYEDVGYFSRFFKKNIGITPFEYREKNQNR